MKGTTTLQVGSDGKVAYADNKVGSKQLTSGSQLIDVSTFTDGKTGYTYKNYNLSGDEIDSEDREKRGQSGSINHEGTIYGINFSTMDYAGNGQTLNIRYPKSNTILKLEYQDGKFVGAHLTTGSLDVSSSTGGIGALTGWDPKLLTRLSTKQMTAITKAASQNLLTFGSFGSYSGHEEAAQVFFGLGGNKARQYSKELGELKSLGKATNVLRAVGELGARFSMAGSMGERTQISSEIFSTLVNSTYKELTDLSPEARQKIVSGLIDDMNTVNPKNVSPANSVLTNWVKSVSNEYDRAGIKNENFENSRDRFWRIAEEYTKIGMKPK